MIVYKIQRFSFPVFTNNYLNIIWYSFYKGRLFILLFPSWISYSTISNYHGVVLVINKKGTNGSQTGSEYVNGSKLQVLQWNRETGHNFEEFWGSHSFTETQALITGDNGYIHPKVANLTPTETAPQVPRGQRPALYR